VCGGDAMLNMYSMWNHEKTTFQFRMHVCFVMSV